MNRENQYHILDINFSENHIYSVQFTAEINKIVKTVLQHVRDEHYKGTYRLSMITTHFFNKKYFLHL